MRRYHGQIVLFSEVKHFGFITSEEELPFGGVEIFFHKSCCIDAPVLGAWVEFEIGGAYKLGRKPQAAKITIHPIAGLETLTKGATGGVE
jgi:cold shock CspA family protein